MLQIFIDGHCIDLTEQNAVSVVKRSKFFTAQPTRTWTITAGRTPTNVGILGKMIEKKRYTARTQVFFGGVELIKGQTRILSWDNTTYNLVVVADGSSALLDDNRTILDFMRQLYERRGGYGVADLTDQWYGTIERGDMDGRWGLTDFFAGAMPNISAIIDALKKADDAPERWPTYEWAEQNFYLKNHTLYGTKPLQIGGWSGTISNSAGKNKLPHDVVECRGVITWKNFSEGGNYNYLEFRDLKQYGDESFFRLGSHWSGSACVLAWGIDTNGVFRTGLVVNKDFSPYPYDNHKVLAANNLELSIKPMIWCGASYGGNIDSTMTTLFPVIDELHGIAVVSVGAGINKKGDAWYWPYLGPNIADKIEIWGNFKNFWGQYKMQDIKAEHLAYISFVVQEREIADFRGNSVYAGGSGEWIENWDGGISWPMPPINVLPLPRPSIKYEPISALGDFKISDLAQICLHIFGVDLDSQNSAIALVSERAVIVADELSAEVMASDNTEQQNTSARQGVVGFDGYVFVRGGDVVEPLKVNAGGGGNFTAQWNIPKNPYSAAPIGTTADAATAQQMPSGGVFLFRMDKFPHPLRFETTSFSADTQATASISKAIRYTAKGRGSVADLLKLHPNGSIRIEGTAVTGVVEQITWTTNGALEVVFWGD